MLGRPSARLPARPTAACLAACLAAAVAGAGCAEAAPQAASRDRLPRRTSGLRLKLTRVAYPEARCLDGSDPVIYLRKNRSSRRWLLFMEGGGFCSSFEDCAEHAQGYYGSTLADEPVRDLELLSPVFSPDPQANPLLNDANWVLMRYCDGAYFTGDVPEPVSVNGRALFFRGRAIRLGVVDLLRRAHGLDVAEEVIFAGCSAGGITALFAADALRASVPWVPRVASFADSGYYLDTKVYTPPKEFIFRAQNSSASLSPGCMLDNPARPWVCFLGSVAVRYGHVPAFTWQSRYDTDQRICEMTPECEASDRCVNEYGELVEASVRAQLTPARGHGYFLDGCSRHCGGVVSWAGYTPLTALQRWYAGEPTQIIQPGSFPCRRCCGPGGTPFRTLYM